MMDISTELNNFLKGSKHYGTHEHIARFILLHINEIPQMKLAEIAENCNTSTTSVIRFCREFGYRDFKDFKESIAIAQAERQGQLKLQGNFEDDDSYEVFVKEWIGKLAQQEQKTLQMIDRKQVERLAEDLVSYRDVYIFGANLSAMFGEYVRVMLSFLDKSVICIQQPDYEVMMAPEKVCAMAIVVSQHERFLKSEPRLFPFLRKNCNKIWLVTQQLRESIYIKQADETLYVRSNQHLNYEFHTLLCVAELICRYCEEIYKQNK